MIKYKEIRLMPAEHKLDIIEVEEDDKHLHAFLKARYGLPKSVTRDTNNIDCCRSVSSGRKSELKGEFRVVVLVRSLKDKPVLVHELIHALWFAADRIGLDMNYDSQEWQALLFEHMYKEATDKNNWTIIKPK